MDRNVKPDVCVIYCAASVSPWKMQIRTYIITAVSVVSVALGGCTAAEIGPANDDKRARLSSQDQPALGLSARVPTHAHKTQSSTRMDYCKSY